MGSLVAYKTLIQSADQQQLATVEGAHPSYDVVTELPSEVAQALGMAFGNRLPVQGSETIISCTDNFPD